jgi:acyl-CoA reductase-like NAD-dependent aldehyde dehydrogenase
VQSVREIKNTKARIKFFVDHVDEAISDKVVFKDNNMEERITRDPLGIIANISAWNYPYFVGSNVYIPGLLTGNGVMYKPSEYATLSGIEMEKLLAEAGFPEHSFKCLIGGADVGSDLLRLPVDGVFFTGSYQTGKKINERVAGKMIKVQLELGGKDPVYVHHDVDIASYVLRSSR